MLTNGYLSLKWFNLNNWRWIVKCKVFLSKICSTYGKYAPQSRLSRYHCFLQTNRICSVHSLWKLFPRFCRENGFNRLWDETHKNDKCWKVLVQHLNKENLWMLTRYIAEPTYRGLMRTKCLKSCFPNGFAP